MPLSFSDLLLRLALALLAGALLGIDRTTRGRPAGMRTTMLVCVAAAVAMILGHILLAERADAERFDPLRLAQGVLAGMGFIGAGAIVRRDDVVLGVTTAATLWFASILGLSFGAGQWELGLAGLGIGVVVLWALHVVEDRIHRERQAHLCITFALDGPGEPEVRRRIESAGYTASSWSIEHKRDESTRTLRCRVKWKARPGDAHLPAFIPEFSGDPKVLGLKWDPVVS